MFASNTSQVSSDVNYIEDFFSAWLRTGTGSSQTVTTGIKENTGALVISKSRSAATDWAWYDTFRGATKDLVSNSTAAETTQSQGLTSFNADGHTWGTLAKVNTSGATYVDYVLKPQPKFFDVVTYTGQTGTPQTIAHNLGSVPGTIIIKAVNDTGNWVVYHRSTGNQRYLLLNSTNAQSTVNTSVWNSTTPTDTNFYVGGANFVNYTGVTYVAYLFAHDAGGFGLTGTDNVISCGSFTGTATVNLGYEPQLVLFKATSAVGSWFIQDNMRGFGTNDAAYLNPNLSDAEGTWSNIVTATSTGFKTASLGSNTYIYIAIRRGPMKTPTSGTEVFAPAIGNNSTSAGGEIFTTNFPVDFFMRKVRATTDFAPFAYSRLTAGKYLVTGTTAAEATDTSTWFDTNTGIDYQYASNLSGQIGWLFQRAPGFFDVVCYTGTGSATTVAHNLGVTPELMIVKNRSAAASWAVGGTVLVSGNNVLRLENTGAVFANQFYWNNTLPTSSVFSVSTASTVNTSGQNYVAYLFASCPGVSKVGSYTGTGTTNQINCGFTSGARFVLIKRTDSTGDWYVWDSARGIVAGNDPYLLLNSTAAEVTSTDYIDPYSAGFEISSTAPAAINASGGSFIFLAIA